MTKTTLSSFLICQIWLWWNFFAITISSMVYQSSSVYKHEQVNNSRIYGRDFKFPRPQISPPFVGVLCRYLPMRCNILTLNSKEKNKYQPQNPTTQRTSNRCTERLSVVISKVFKYLVKRFQKISLKKDKSRSLNCRMSSIIKGKRGNWHS